MSRGTAISDKAIEAALDAWFAGGDDETDDPPDFVLARSMKRAIRAALRVMKREQRK